MGVRELNVFETDVGDKTRNATDWGIVMRIRNMAYLNSSSFPIAKVLTELKGSLYGTGYLISKPCRATPVFYRRFSNWFSFFGLFILEKRLETSVEFPD